MEDLFRIEPDSPHCGLEEKIYLGREVFGAYKSEIIAITELGRIKQKRKKECCEQHYKKDYHKLCSRVNNILFDKKLHCYRIYEVKEDVNFTS